MDGVLVDTARFHFRAWQKLAATWNYELTTKDNDKLKGVSRMDSIRKIASWANIDVADEHLIKLANKKNEEYLNLCKTINGKDILPGVLNFLEEAKRLDIPVAVGSASKNALFVLNQLQILDYFQVVVDGNMVLKSKPDPEVFVQAARKMKVSPHRCVVFEDAEAGVQAANAAQMKSVGIGEQVLKQAHIHRESFVNLKITDLNNLLDKTF